jgi:hypothetical protein
MWEFSHELMPSSQTVGSPDTLKYFNQMPAKRRKTLAIYDHFFSILTTFAA